MNNSNNISLLYKNKPVEVEQNIASNSFTDMIFQTKTTATETVDKLAYLAGIKNVPADDKYQKLNTSNLTSFLESAKLLGYDIEVVGI
ncbi:XRE family transcriptional regulator [Proteus sp. G2615]|uniref:XRE family transcriptional regulator n=1 Tax=Proteus sp. G2615 TaxID=2698845 RepID=UPI001376D59F|nr:XRE family transcriptional regulator [Proteus sp. G2615]NBN74329.1 XRE family transcriptional regulator [Proteus sp. G2615]